MKRKKISEYQRYVQNCVKHVQLEMALGNVSAHAELPNIIHQSSSIFDPIKACKILQNDFPKKWGKYVDTDHEEHWEKIAIELFNKQVKKDVQTALEKTDGYRFLGGRKRMKCISYQGKTITFVERWKSIVEPFEHVSPQEIVQWKKKELSVYQGKKPIYVLEHSDPSLAWRSVGHMQEKLVVQEYEHLKSEYLGKYGFPKKIMWLSECITVSDFAEYHGQELTEDLELLSYRYVVYYHESGNVHVHQGFNNFREFDKACRSVSQYFGGRESELSH